MINGKHFAKTISQREFDYRLFTNLPRITVICDDCSSSFKLKRDILPLYPTYPNLKTTCHIKLNFFFWTKLQENLLLAKYIISVSATFSITLLHLKCQFIFFYFMKMHLKGLKLVNWHRTKFFFYFTEKILIRFISV